MQRAYRINIGNSEIIVDFGKDDDYVTEVKESGGGTWDINVRHS